MFRVAIGPGGRDSDGGDDQRSSFVERGQVSGTIVGCEVLRCTVEATLFAVPQVNLIGDTSHRNAAESPILRG